jgi:cyclopropane-fatty-acyl-phospholipid synthase
MLSEAWTTRALERLASQIRAPVTLELWNGERFQLSDSPAVAIKLTSPAAVKYLKDGSLAGLGEAFVEGHLDVSGALRDIIRVAEEISSSLTSPSLRKRLLPGRRHSRRLDSEAIRFHYDVSNEFYQLWLDRNMVYSCAYFQTGQEDIHTAQEKKLDHICRKLQLTPGERFLDIGCGWGALIRRAAAHYGVHATGITLSENQYAYAKATIEAEGLADRCEVKLMDYRDVPGEGCFDKIASVGMFEHVGLKNLPVYFATASRLLRENGVFMNHGITSMSADGMAVPYDAGDFMDRYVFPHGELPHVAEAVAEMSRQSLEVVDVESLRPHYAQTLALWADRLVANRDEAVRHAGEKRYRIWQIYLAGCSHAFERGWMSIHQVLAVRKRDPGPHELPWTRAYMYPSN